MGRWAAASMAFGKDEQGGMRSWKGTLNCRKKLITYKPNGKEKKLGKLEVLIRLSCALVRLNVFWLLRSNCTVCIFSA